MKSSIDAATVPANSEKSIVIDPQLESFEADVRYYAARSTAAFALVVSAGFSFSIFGAAPVIEEWAASALTTDLVVTVPTGVPSFWAFSKVLRDVLAPSTLLTRFGLGIQILLSIPI